MNIYLLTQSINNKYDTYDSCVVIAENETEAKKINPDKFYKYIQELNCFAFVYYNGTYKVINKNSGWAHSPEQVTATLIGKAKENSKPGIVCASFNAG